MERHPNTTSIIISDLHLGKSDDFDIFKSPGKEEAFEAFLDHCGKVGDLVELIVNGDFVDFLQLKPWDIYSKDETISIREQALSKITEIVQGNVRVFKALATFLGKSNTRLVVLLGNHDVELAYDEVWSVVEKALLSSGGDKTRLQFINRATQYNFSVGGAKVHVEHGNIGDPFNEILYKKLFEDAETSSGFQFPPGTRFVYEVMNKFKEQLRFVDLLKPEMPTVPLLLVRLEPFPSMQQLPKTSLNLMRALKEGLIGRVRQKAGGGSFGEKEQEAPPPNDPLDVMATLYVEEVDPDPDHLEKFLQENTAAIESSEPTFAPKWMERIKATFGNAILKRLGRPARLGDVDFFQVNQSGTDVELAQERVRGDIQIVIFGHTHAALKNEFSEKTVYVNSGAWANLIELPAESKDFPAWLELLANNKFERTSFPTYVTLTPGTGGVEASLNYWSPKGEQILWSKSITASK
ncbi:MAG TPA: metallophosphoesterase [Candidatus Acidoferrales bacterium]|nr:metallophosphoesterase [Candidatus Acidoferrales bacterium]